MCKNYIRKENNDNKEKMERKRNRKMFSVWGFYKNLDLDFIIFLPHAMFVHGLISWHLQTRYWGRLVQLARRKPIPFRSSGKEKTWDVEFWLQRLVSGQCIIICRSLIMWQFVNRERERETRSQGETKIEP